MAVLLSGCGGGKSDEDSVRSTAKAYLGALADADGKKACDLLTGDEKRKVVDALSAQLPELNVTSCEDGVTGVAKNLGEDEKKQLRDAKIVVKVNGSSATAVAEGSSSPPARMTKSGDSWLIASGLFE
jgi:hypothetical protein